MKSLRVISLILLYLAPVLGILLFGGLIFLGYYHTDKLDFLLNPYYVLIFELRRLESLTNVSLTILNYGVILLWSNVVAAIIYLPLMSLKNNKGWKLWGIINTLIVTVIVTILSVLFLYCVFAPSAGILEPLALHATPIAWEPFLFLLPALLLWIGLILAIIHFSIMRHRINSKKETKANTINKIEINNYHVYDNKTVKENPQTNPSPSVNTSSNENNNEMNNNYLQDKVQKLRQKLNNNNTNQKNFTNSSNFQREKYASNTNSTNNEGVYYQTINKQTRSVNHQSNSGQKMAEKVEFVQPQDKVKKINNNFFSSQQDNVNAKFTINNKKNINDGDKIWRATKLYRQDIVNKNKDDDENNEH